MSQLDRTPTGDGDHITVAALCESATLKPRPTPPAQSEDDPNTVICPSRGVKDIGTVDPEAAKALGVAAGAVRLVLGHHGRTGGWGLKHLEGREDRQAAIKALGYASCEVFVFAVAASWTEVHEAAEPNRIKLVWPNKGLHLALVVEWTGEFWTVITALPFRPTDKPKLYERKTG